ncbi:hypothetical protein AAVH_37054, partial [Aphelenchoides avenae]
STVTLLPKEALLDVLYFLDRFSLDRVQYCSKLLLEIVSSNACSLALREINYASLSNHPSWNLLEPYEITLEIEATIETRAELKESSHKQVLIDKPVTYQQFLKFVRHSFTRRLCLKLRFTTDLVRLLRQVWAYPV